ncbi:hypothetical protein QOZ80_4AG0300900 [Eleusine coracana subsp. coracana]|nr:hypothetical protein QOZ80_4AG0300900 [Eleusine coracana subsp. coracana]
MRRRWSRAAVVACLVLLASACVAESRAVRRAATTATSSSSEEGGAARRGAFDLMVVGLVSIGLGRRWRAGDELVDEDKRRVPTGPNPLHNR